jgi:hypothetical protein
MSFAAIVNIIDLGTHKEEEVSIEVAPVKLKDTICVPKYYLRLCL